MSAGGLQGVTPPAKSLMASGNLLLGTARKKLGDVVFYRTGGQQRSRVRVIPKNPRTAKQAVQRMILATAAKMAAAYEPIINHSFEGVDVGSASVNEFKRYAMHMLRNVAAVYFDPTAEDTAGADFAIKGAPVVGILEGLQISRGRLPMNAYSVASNAVTIQLSSALAAGNITTQEQYVAELAKFGIEPGNQLTFVTLLEDFDQVVASVQPEGEQIATPNCAQAVKFCRIVFASTLPTDFNDTLVKNGAFNPALVVDSVGAQPVISTATTNLVATFTSVLPGNYSLVTAAVIRSQLDGGRYYYSSAVMAADPSNLGYNNADPVYQSYMDGTAEINLGDNLYLRNAVATPFDTAQVVEMYLGYMGESGPVQLGAKKKVLSSEFTAGAAVSVTFPANDSASLIMFDWPTPVTLSLISGDGSLEDVSVAMNKYQFNSSTAMTAGTIIVIGVQNQSGVSNLTINFN